MQPFFSGHPFSYSRWRRSFMYQQSRTFLSAMQAINLHTKEIITLFVVGLGWPSKWSLRKIFHFCCVCFIRPLHGSSDKKKTHYWSYSYMISSKKSNSTSNKTQGHKSGDTHLIGLQQMHLGLWLCDKWCCDQLRKYCQTALSLIVDELWVFSFRLRLLHK